MFFLFADSGDAPPAIRGGGPGRLTAVNGPLSLKGDDRAVLERAGGCQPHDGQMADAVAPSDVHQGFALLAPRQGLTLMRVELRRTSEAHATLFGPLAALTRPGANQLALEFGEPAEHRRRRSISGPYLFRIAERGPCRACAGQGSQIEIDSMPTADDALNKTNTPFLVIAEHIFQHRRCVLSQDDVQTEG